MIRTNYQPPLAGRTRGVWTAVEDDFEPGRPVGFGFTEAEALNDLTDQLTGFFPDAAQEAEMLRDLADEPSPSAVDAAAVLEAHL